MELTLNHDSLVNNWAGTFTYVGRSGWLNLDELDYQIRELKYQLVVDSGKYAQFCQELQTSNWSELFERCRSEFYVDLLWRAECFQVEKRRLQYIQRLASTDLEKACRILAAEINRAFTERLAKLRRQLRAARSLKILLLRFASTIYKFRNKIVLQRRFYLAHGSHPTENLVYQNGDRLSRLIGGCTPAFQQ